MGRLSGRRIPFLPRADDASEEHLEALIEELPEVAPKPPLPFVPADAPAMQADEELDDLLARLRERLSSRAGDPRRLDALRAELAALRDENARLLRQLDLYERAFRSLKDLASDVEEASR